ncbi:peptidase M24, structural domain-containing protein [Tribonema minus]|uniref:Peptidase M24, structural domain-containing protein n=1 Tax=Tribonema minus TaxID=303371 RepID=A0A835YL31_9STRA|nr:peptidase M24, structural domain-containing protein [Tribonema minus]
MSDAEDMDVPTAAEEEGEEVQDLSNSDVTTKYQEAAKIVNLALSGVVQQCVAGARLTELCKFGDTVITTRCAQIFQKKVKGVAVEKGIAFPTCISVNECVCNNSPLESEAEQQPPLADGDLVKIELGCHVAGYIAVAAHTVKVGAAPTAEAPATGAEADVMLACYQAAQLAAAAMVPGATNDQVAETVRKVATSYGVNIVTGTKMHQLKPYIINGSKTVVPRADEPKHEAITFAANEVYAVNVLVTSGEGKPKEGAQATTIFKRAIDKKYKLKMNASRNLFNQISVRFPTLPFCLRAFDDERQARLGVKECVNHDLLEPFPVLYGHSGEVIAQAKFTVLLLPSGPSIVAGSLIDYEAYKSDKTLDEESAAALQAAQEKAEAKKKKKTSKKKK